MATWMNGGRAGCALAFMLGLCMSLQLGGCVAGAATVGVDVAESVAEHAVAVVQFGKAESYQVVPIESAEDTVRRVAKEMELTEIKEKKHPDQIKIIYKDGRGQEIVVTIVERTESVTELHVDVGLFGVEGMARLTMRRILHELPGGTEEEKKAVE